MAGYAILKVLCKEYRMMHEHGQLTAPLLDGSSAGAADTFRSVLIIAYEQALEEGVSPSAAIGIALDWISIELKRCVRPSHASG
jgi:hypothetical protein